MSKKKTIKYSVGVMSREEIEKLIDKRLNDSIAVVQKMVNEHITATNNQLDRIEQQYNEKIDAASKSQEEFQAHNKAHGRQIERYLEGFNRILENKL